jgi:class 3 adenylate cyclase
MIGASYTNVPYKLRHVVGVDTSDLFIAKTGIRGDNDLVSVGRAANHAAKLSAMPGSHQTHISGDAVFRKLNSDAKTSHDGRLKWESLPWNEMDGRRIYRSNWGYRVD